MKRLQSGLSVLMALLIAMPFFPVTTAVAQDTEINIPDYSGRSDSFVQYLAAIEGQPAADEALSLNAADAALSPTLSEKQEEDGTLRLESGGYAEWTFTVGKSGVYDIHLSYLASTGKGRKPQITLELDGSVPYTEASNYELSRIYRDAGPIEQNAEGDDLIPEQVEVERWQDRPLLDTAGLSGRNLCLYLPEGTHTLRLTCESESLYIRSLTLSPGTTVPTDAEQAAFYEQEGYESVDGVFKIYQAEETLEKSDVVLYPTYDRTSQPLEMDYLIVHSAEQELPSPRASFWQQVCHFFKTFFASFQEDYNTVGGSGSEGAITVWANIGRDQIQVIKNLVVDQFTPQTGIDVTLSVVQTGFIEATLAGRGPDVAIGMARGQPINLACRNALLPFDSYEGFEAMKERFADTALVPYQYNGQTFGIPCTQTFFMMFYRKDILAEMGIAVPRTWTEIMETVPKLQRSHMTIGLPYAVISAATAVDNGLGAKDLFATLLLQNGGTFYNEDHSATALDSEASMTAFKTWSDFYTKYGFDLIYDFYTRFSTGEMPIGIASYEMFNTLSVAAQEIRGLWGMAPIPGTVREDGTIDTSEAGAGSAAVIFKKTDSPDSCYQFVDWWTSDKTQTDFCTAVENQLGPGGRYATANLAAFSSQPWSSEELEMLTAQRENVIELPEIPGSYYVSRSIDNAFRAVLYDNKNPRETFEQENRNINEEIARKRRELGLDSE